MLTRTAKSCGPDAPALASSWRKHVGPTGPGCALSASDGDNKPIAGEITKETVKTIACGSAGLIRWTCGDYTRVLSTFAHEAAGALGIRRSPRPLLGGSIKHNSGESRRGNADSHVDVIARSNATKQSTLSLRGEMDCFAEPVIGRASARPVGSQ